METYTLPPKPERSLFKKIKTILIAAIIVAIYVWTFLGIDIDWARAIARIQDNFARVIPNLFSPDWSATAEVSLSILETVLIAFAGSLMAAILAIPLGFLAAHNMTRSRILTTIGKWILSAVRAFPDIILAILFVVAVGPNAFAGVLAIAIGSTGMLGKLYSEVIESIDMKVVEAMEANGANKIQILFYAVIPQIIPEFLSYAIYRFEVDIRASSILGIVGAGGIGTMIIFAANNRNWNEMGLILLAIIIVVTIIDFISARIRRKIV
ncbi:phosphate-import permease protein PhnE [Oceanobacillus picturae]|uniref:Phosphate-import permease protein PhnE n=1 Tax=Oceanobacillus picturae TaxID=171693 RepID=W9AMJ6_9BACI|nr:phosphonate ABC transporter, permease protein PhnE [Oceanobacillus picturae]RIU89086.1 phosphonate ABC transporter, permease protein PhnE [Oceanobacillus picturae]GAQ17789.1 phosphate-import permease protein PhnE [Oceanobacillus picturae]CDO04102.1 Phosphate-import permease protein PhnE [Oceanobacillus picturae]